MQPSEKEGKGQKGSWLFALTTGIIDTRVPLAFCILDTWKMMCAQNVSVGVSLESIVYSH